MEHMTQRELAVFLSTNEHEVRLMASAGILPKPVVPGRWDSRACLHAYIKHLRSLWFGSDPHGYIRAHG
jgi:hypothetical protein